jgi:DNA-binding NtrC family response regulator
MMQRERERTRRKERILFVDDDEAGRELGLYNLGQAGFEAVGARDGAEALACFEGERFDLVVTDLRMPGVSGMELLARLRELAPDVPVVVITAHGSVEAAVQAMKAGAYDFLEKPFGREVLLLAASRALERRRLALENQDLRRRASGIEREIVRASPVMERLLHAVDRVAGSEATVLITGESGTGKELVARRLHARGPRGQGPFVAVSCAAVPEGLLESELFGHERGAYTGATRPRLGRFRRASGGTLFLDDVSELPLALQAKLLRALQERVVDPVGSDQPVPVDARVVASTNRTLEEEVRAGRFRADLFYRLNVVELRVPPLRDRVEEVEPLARFFVARAAPERELALEPALLSALAARPWPGNVRELENVCERLVILCEGDTLRLEDLPPAPRTHPGASASLAEREPEPAPSVAASPPPASRREAWPPLPAGGLSLVDLERQVIERALELEGGNVTRTAAYLRIPRHVLAYRIEKYGLRRG